MGIEYKKFKINDLVETNDLYRSTFIGSNTMPNNIRGKVKNIERIEFFDQSRRGYSYGRVETVSYLVEVNGHRINQNYFDKVTIE